MPPTPVKQPGRQGTSMEFERPVNPIPPVVVILVLIVAGVEATLSLAQAGLLGGKTGIGWRSAAVQDWAFSPAVWDRVWINHDTSLGILRRFVTYVFVHSSFTHALFAGVLLLAIGKFVGEVFHWFSLLIVFLASAIGAAVVYGIVTPTNYALLGAYPPVYGLIGSFTYLLWLRLGQTGGNQMRAFALIGFLLALRLVYTFVYNVFSTMGLTGDTGPSPDAFYGLADVTGFVIGLALSVLVAPGGWSAFLGRIRAR